MTRKSLIIVGVLFLSSVIAVSVAAQELQPVKVMVDGLEFTYIEKGQGERLILLHGGMGDYRSWSPQMEAFARKYRVISYSRRYSYPNRNPLSERNYSAFVDADDLAAFLG